MLPVITKPVAPSRSKRAHKARSATPPIDIRPLYAAHTSDPDDAYAWWAVATRQIHLPGYNISVSTSHIQDINEACRHGRYDIAAISSAAWPLLSKDYAILSTGASVGRGYGPALAVREGKILSSSSLCGKKIAIPGTMTTGALLLRLFYPEADPVPMRFDRVAMAVFTGEVDGGVLIHEELLNWYNKGLRRLVCLGNLWQQRTGLPIPVGLNVVHRRHGEATIARIGQLLADSLLTARRCPQEAIEWALAYSIQTEDGIGEKFIEMFANDDTLSLDADCLKALNLLFEMALERGLIPVKPLVELVQPAGQFEMNNEMSAQ